MTRVADHANHDFESLQKFKLEQRFNSVVVDEFQELRKFHRERVFMDMAKLFEELLKSMEKSIDKGEVQVIDMITKE